GGFLGPLWGEFYELSHTDELKSAPAPSLALPGGRNWPRGREDGVTRVRLSLRGIRANGARAESVLAGADGLRSLGDFIQSQVFAGMRRVLEAEAGDVRGGGPV